MKTRLVIIALPLFLIAANPAWADPVSIHAGDTLQSQIEGQKGKRVTLRLISGEDITGTVRDTTKELVQLGELSGKEFYDAVIDISKVSALIVRNR